MKKIFLLTLIVSTFSGLYSAQLDLFKSIVFNDTHALYLVPHTSQLDSKQEVNKVDKLAKFNGNINAFLSKHLIYPNDALKNEIEGRVIVGFEVGKDGLIYNVEILKGLGYGCDEEVIRVVKLMPRWQPAELDGERVNSYYKLPVTFVLE